MRVLKKERPIMHIKRRESVKGVQGHVPAKEIGKNGVICILFKF